MKYYPLSQVNVNKTGNRSRLGDKKDNIYFFASLAFNKLQHRICLSSRDEVMLHTRILIPGEGGDLE